MEGEGLKPGDRIVDLGGLAMDVAALTGGVAGGWIVWLLRDNWLTAIGALVAGAIVGYVSARVVVEFVCHTADGRIQVVRVGRASLPATVRAGIVGGMTAAVVVAVIGLILFGLSNVTALIGIPFGCAVAIGVTWGCLAPLL